VRAQPEQSRRKASGAQQEYITGHCTHRKRVKQTIARAEHETHCYVGGQCAIGCSFAARLPGTSIEAVTRLFPRSPSPRQPRTNKTRLGSYPDVPHWTRLVPQYWVGLCCIGGWAARGRLTGVCWVLIGLCVAESGCPEVPRRFAGQSKAMFREWDQSMRLSNLETGQPHATKVWANSLIDNTPLTIGRSAVRHDYWCADSSTGRG
jgi:hypothetical protein